jgi:transcriptional regulator with XRE-family HTH domain
MSEDVLSTFGSRVREIRTRLGLTQGEFGRGLGISIQHLSDIELDKKKPCHDFFYHMAKVYRINLYYLLLGEGAMFAGEKESTPPEGIKTGNPDVDNFLKYFFTTDIVKFDALRSFSILMVAEGDRINKSLSSGMTKRLRTKKDQKK